jgi:hypothetical protein
MNKLDWKEIMRDDYIIFIHKEWYSCEGMNGGVIQPIQAKYLKHIYRNEIVHLTGGERKKNESCIT